MALTGGALGERMLDLCPCIHLLEFFEGIQIQRVFEVENWRSHALLELVNECIEFIFIYKCTEHHTDGDYCVFYNFYKTKPLVGTCYNGSSDVLKYSFFLEMYDFQE